MRRTGPPTVGPRFDAPRTPETLQRREQLRRTAARFTCTCGAELLVVPAHRMDQQRATTRVLVQQAHRKHARETGCTQGIA